MKTYYEWDYETIDESGDILDHNHANKLNEFSENQKTETLVLVRDVGVDNIGLMSRNWAYVEDGKLPAYFKDEEGNDTYLIPKKFHTELKIYLNNS